MKRPYQKGDTVRLLTTVRMDGWKTDCTPGYRVTIATVNADGTLVVTRTGPDGRATVQASDVEPAYRVVHGTYYSSRTPRRIIEILEEARESGQALHVHYGDPVTGRDWLEEWDVEGTIGRSLGPVKIPLLIAPGECGGPGVLDDAILKIRSGGVRLYQHPQYHTGKITLRPITPADVERVPTLQDYTTAIEVDGEPRANFREISDAVQWISRLGLTIKSLTGSFTGEIVGAG